MFNFLFKFEAAGTRVFAEGCGSEWISRKCYNYKWNIAEMITERYLYSEAMGLKRGLQPQLYFSGCDANSCSVDLAAPSSPAQ